MPIETIHEVLVEASTKPEIDDHIAMAKRVDRFISNWKRRVAWGHYKTDAELLDALNTGEEALVSPLLDATFEIRRQYAVKLSDLRQMAQHKE